MDETISDITKTINIYKPENRQITNDTYSKKVWDIVKNNIDPVDFDAVTIFLEGTGKSYKTIRSYYISILVYLKAKNLPYLPYIIHQRKMANKIHNDDKMNTTTPSERKLIVTDDDYKKIIQRLQMEIKNYTCKNTRQHHDLIQDLLIVNLYYLIPPVRNNYVNTIITKDIPGIMDPEINYFCLKSKTLVLNRYKTDKVYGTIFIDVPETIIKLVTKLVNKRKKLDCVMKSRHKHLILFKNRQNELQHIGSMKQTLNRIFGDGISVTVLRKSYISNKYNSIFSIADMEKDAEIMGHSIQQQQSTYRKIL